MATITSTADGNWHTGATWVGGVAPVTGDTAVVVDVVTVASSNAVACRALTVSTGGSIVQNDTITMDNHADALITLEDGMVSWTNGGTGASPVSITSAGGDSPTNKWKWKVEDQTTVPDSRTLDFDYTEMTGNYWYLGNDTYYIHFNGGAATDPFIDIQVPLLRDPNITEHYCEGRDYGRIYQQGTFAGTVTINGYVHWDKYEYVTLRDMVSSKERISFFGRYDHLPTCRIERPSFSPTSGDPIIPLSITLVEDR